MPSTFSVRAETREAVDLASGERNSSRKSRPGRGARSASSKRSGAVGRGFRRTSAWLLAAVVAACPLLAGSVHRPVVLVVLAALSVTLFCALAGEQMRNRKLRGAGFSLVFVCLVLMPLLQVVPLPMSVRRVLDPAGTALLENAPDGPPASWPLSLDPLSTGGEIGTAAAALVVFMVALHYATRSRHRPLFLKAIAVAGVAGVISGVVHRLGGIERLYGMFTVTGAVLPGPFINPNHSAEFFELAAFAALSLALGAEAEERIAWYVAAAINAAAALSTLSRGSFLALFVGGTIFVTLRLRADRAGEPGAAARPGAGPLARTIAWSLGALACLVSVAIALGAAPVLDEVARTNLTSGTEKTMVWRDSWPLVLHHPLGIGRHAFDRVYPVYKTLAQNSRFQFVEDGPLQLLIDLGWPGVILLGVALLLVARKVPSRRDYVGAALSAGLAAVLAHNLVDFGLETMGIRLPFAAMAGVLVGRACGRTEGNEREEAGRRSPWIRIVVITTAVLGLAAGLWTELHRSADQLEDRWRQTPRGEARREVAVEGGRRYPTDFYFPLLQSYDEPLRPIQRGGVSPRLAALNRALRLCPSCASVYEQAARALFRLDLRAQALSTFRRVVRLAPERLGTVLEETDADGFAPADLATLAVGDSDHTLQVARYLVGKRAEREVTALLNQAASQGAAESERLLIKARLLMALGRLNEAEQALDQGRREAPRDGRFEDALASVAEKQGRPEEALSRARAAATLSPSVVDFARHWVTLVIQLRAWPEIETALDHLKVALRQNGQNVTEAHMIAGDVQAARGNLARALSEYRTAASLDGNNASTWEAVGRTAETRGDMHGAEEAYRHVLALRPGDAGAEQAIARVEKAWDDARLRQLLPAHATGDGEHHP